MKIKKWFLILSFVMLTILGLLYGISPRWFAETFLDIPEMSLDFAHMLRALMCLYLGLGLFWLYSAFCDKYRNAAVLTTMIFAGGLLTGRIISVTETVARSQVEEVRSTGQSLMPEGLEQGLVPQDFADLISFIRQIGSK